MSEVNVIGSGIYSVSSDVEHRWDGRSRIWDEARNLYVTDPFGEVLVFAHAHDAARFIATRDDGLVL